MGPRCRGAGLLLLLLTALLVGTAWGADVLVLRRDWAPAACAVSGDCVDEYPDTFHVASLYLYGDTGATTACDGKGGLKKEDIEGSDTSRTQFECAWQNYTAGVKSLQAAWKDQWDEYGKCTPAEDAVGYLELGVQLDQAYPLPQDLPESVNRDALAAAVEEAFGAAPYIVCSSNKQLQAVTMCFDAASVGGEDGPTPVDCPFAASAACAGELEVPRGGTEPEDCADYYGPSAITAEALAAAAKSLAAPPPPASKATSPPPAPKATKPPAAPAAQPPAVPATSPPTTAEATASPPVPAAPVTVPAPAQQTPATSTDDSGSATDSSSTDSSATDSSSTGGSTTADSGSTDSEKTSNVPAPDASQQTTTATTAAADTDVAVSTSGSDDSSTSTSSMVMALAIGAAGGVVVGIAVFGTAYFLYRRRKARTQAVAAVPRVGDADPEKGSRFTSSSGSGSASSWSSKDSGAKRVDSRTSGKTRQSSGNAKLAAPAAPAARNGSGGGGLPPSPTLPRRGTGSSGHAHGSAESRTDSMSSRGSGLQCGRSDVGAARRLDRTFSGVSASGPPSPMRSLSLGSTPHSPAPAAAPPSPVRTQSNSGRAPHSPGHSQSGPGLARTGSGGWQGPADMASPIPGPWLQHLNSPQRGRFVPTAPPPPRFVQPPPPAAAGHGASPSKRGLPSVNE